MKKLKFESQLHEDGVKPCLAVKSDGPDDGDWVATVASTDEAAELVKRSNRYPLLVAFIQQLGKFKNDDETIDFIVNNIDDVLEDEDGEDVDDPIEYFNNPELFDQD
jgi:hypothetical protein